MLRLAVLTGLVAFIWFALNDSPGVTNAVSSAPKSAVTAPQLAVTTPQKSVLAQAPTERSAQTRQTRQPRKPKAATRISIYSAGGVALGPRAVRHCVDWYAQERRPSGTVVVPHMRCRWVRR